MAILDLLDYNQSLFAIDLNREGRAAPGPKRWVAPFNSYFNVLWIVVAAPDKDQILEPAGDEQFTTIYESQISGSEEWPLSIISQVRTEGLFRLFRAVPVTSRNAIS